MHKQSLSRRTALAQAGLLMAGAVLGEKAAAQSPSNPARKATGEAFRYCLNTATIRGQKLGLAREIEVAAKAGYDAIEPWVDAIQKHVEGGGTLADLKKQIGNSGLTVESAIGLPECIVEDDARRAKGMERAKREMDLVAQIGGKRFAAPPAGATDLPRLHPIKAVERYRA